MQTHPAIFITKPINVEPALSRQTQETPMKNPHADVKKGKVSSYHNKSMIKLHLTYFSSKLTEILYEDSLGGKYPIYSIDIQ